MKNDRPILTRRRRLLLLAALMTAALLQPVIAGDMPWFQTTTKQQVNVAPPRDGWTIWAVPTGQTRAGATLIDVVISLHTQPAGDNDVTTADDRTPYEQIIQYFADAVYEESNAAHKLRNVRIYTNGFYADKADITWSASGWPCANTCGRGTAGQHVFMFTDFSGTNFLTNQELGGYCLGHEWGHYFYGMYDEYKASNTTNDAVINQPHSTDDATNVAIMNNQWNGKTDKNYLNFSTSTRTDYTTVNAQFRVYKAACWQTLARNSTSDPRDGDRSSLPVRPYYSELAAAAPVAQAGASVPSRVDLPAAAARSDLHIIWMESNVVYQIVIDRSGSMYSDNKMSNAKTAAKLLVDAAPLPAKTGDPAIVKIGVVDFDDMVTVTQPITAINTQADKDTIKAAIDTLYDRGSTAIFDAAMTALSGLNATATNESKVVFLLSDGYENASTNSYATVISSYAAAQVPIFSFGYGSSVDPQLISLAGDTGGKYYASPTSLAAITGAFQDAVQAATTTTGVATGSSSLPAGQTQTYPILIDPSLTQLDVVVTYVGAPADATVELEDPSGGAVTSDTPTQSGTETLVHFSVASPVSGTYLLSVTPDPGAGPLDVTYRATATPADQATYTVALASLTGADVSYPEPIVLLATLEKGLPISGAVVTATVTAPNGDVSSLTLTDDGVPPDAVANDGRYSAIFGYSQDGVYNIDVSMSNSAGLANYTYAGTEMALDANGNSGNVPPAPVAEDFMRFARLQVTTSGVSTDDHGDTPSAATAIAYDNSDTDGKIDKAADKDVFSFTVTSPTGPTVVRVTDFALGMSPRLRIIGSDQTTVLADEDVNSSPTTNGYLAVSLAASDGDVLYAEVSHTDPTAVTGTYRISAGPSIPGDFSVKFTSPAASRVASATNSISIAGIASAGCQTVVWASDRGGSGACTGTTSWSKSGITLLPGTNLITVTATSSTGEQATATLAAVFWTGLAMVSVPLIPSSIDPGAIIDFTSWMRYDPAQSAYVVYGSAADNTSHFTWFDPATSTPGKGYWSYWQSPGTSLPTGTAPSQTAGVSIPLTAGWNIVGNPFLGPLQWRVANILVKHGSTTKTLADAKTAGWCADYLWGYEQSSSDPMTGSYFVVYDTGVASAAEGWMKPWSGYWFKALVDCELILPAP